MAGFRLAAAGGADYLELDVQRTVDDVLVVIHDEDLARTTDGDGVVADTTAEALGAVDAGSWFGPAFAGERVPLLAGVVSWLVDDPSASRLAIIVEAKGVGTGRPIATALAASRLRPRSAICSFSPTELRAARDASPDIPTMLIVDRDRPADDPVEAARTCGATMVNVPWSWLDPAAVARLHHAGLLVAGGTADTAADIATCLRLGLDAVDSNDPGAAVAERDRRLRMA
jgi:glycerophosphoryl diester phosphodiesterase